MTTKEILDVLNSAGTFGLLFAIIVMLWILIMKKETKKSPKR